jgi:hypothetical protein
MPTSAITKLPRLKAACGCHVETTIAEANALDDNAETKADVTCMPLRVAQE